ncbi:hypothetical protein ACF0H5_000555 [Mactra antiquata]
MRMEYLFVLILAACNVGARRVVDLTHTFDKNAPKYPLDFLGYDSDTFTYFNMTILADQFFGDMWLGIRQVEFYEHQGTHIDAPNHFGSGRQAMDEIPPERLIGEGVVIDVRDKVKQNPDYAVSVQDIKDHESKYGKIPPGAIVCMNSGWADKYPDPVLVFGSNDLKNVSTFHFPGFSLDACKMLLNERQVGVVGVDTPSTDPGQADGYYCHMYLQPNQVPLLEYVANLDSVPARGTTMVLGAMKMRDGTGGPTRIFAFMDDMDGDGTNTANMYSSSVLSTVCSLMIASYITSFMHF